jgi:hypothetical protein
MNRLHSLAAAWKVLAAAVLLVATASIGAPAAHAAQAFNFSMPETGVLTNACPGSEPVAVSGSAHFLGTVTSSAGGTGYHMTFSINFQGVKGIGLVTGTQYEIILNVETAINGVYGVEQTVDYHGVSVAPGPDNNDLFQFLFHVTVTPAGAVTASITNGSENCTQ